MVSLQTTISQDLSKKRKWGEIKAKEISDKPQQVISLFGTEFQHESPLPLDWQRCLDIKSGDIYFYNTRTQKRVSRDPRLSPEPTSPDHMSLDLQLNLPCRSSENNRRIDNFTKRNYISNSSYSGGDTEMKRSDIARSLSWLTFDGDQQEMFTAVCKKCHMLVMLCKSSPSCPNCKFINPAPDLISTPIYPVQEKAKPLMFNKRSILVTKD